MNLPNHSNMMNVGQLRYIQLHYDEPKYRNPDYLVGSFLSMRQRLACILRGNFFLSRSHANPFYHYVLARTKYYDEVFLDAVYAPVSCIINIGCGTDTRAHRFAHILKQKRVAVVECDQPEAIRVKQKIARRRWNTDHIEYVALDLNDAAWADFGRLLDEKSRSPALVMLEGVSPYIRSDSFEAFLRLLATKLHPESRLAYDFKVAGVVKDFGRTARVQEPFRLQADWKELATYHQALGFELQNMETSPQLSQRLLDGTPLLFDEDCLLRLKPCARIP